MHQSSQRCIAEQALLGCNEGLHHFQQALQSYFAQLLWLQCRSSATGQQQLLLCRASGPGNACWCQGHNNRLGSIQASCSSSEAFSRLVSSTCSALTVDSAEAASNMPARSINYASPREADLQHRCLLVHSTGVDASPTPCWVDQHLGAVPAEGTALDSFGTMLFWISCASSPSAALPPANSS